ncbi:sulfatase [Curtobacterium sp. MCBA15_001]|uniref:sulfatase n=1 Tax=Curtobacterium sp. MCBA15_001 TaxID=1898731 RepID=UPI0008DC5DEC|nr:sulfatase [Curtobacterium sp. MCBA15_001]OIH94295.1 sulfatase [Curtobacterium sp. MCBA15_001]
MRAVVVLFDSLNRRFLPPYGADWVHAPNFARLARRTVRFDNCYAGSMPCMPARRELHTARPNFMHRSWGPLEPFDDSVPEMLSGAGVYTHLVTDHPHYWEDGGATYHNRFDTYEFFRGQEGDAWKGHVADPAVPDSSRRVRHGLWRQDLVNRQYLQDEADHPQTRTVDAGLEFMATNREADSWMVQIECFDPHEPYFSHREYRRHYPSLDASGSQDNDWPDYKRVDEPPEAVERTRDEYAALLSMCDASLGRILDRFDDEGLWEDTLLMVCTDHGFLLGEHGWWGKNAQPWYDETIHTPLFLWDPVSGRSDESRDQLVQTIDLGPTLLDLFGVAPTERMQGRSVLPVIRTAAAGHDTALFGSFGGHVNVTDGRYVYMRAASGPDNAPLHEHTLMPTHMNSRFTPDELEGAELVPPFRFTRGVPLLRVRGTAFSDASSFGTVLFDLESDPEQEHPVLDDDLELRMIGLLLDAMRANEAPLSQYARLGLPETGAADHAHLLARTQHDRYLAALEPLPMADEFPTDRAGVRTAIAELLALPETRAVLVDAVGPVVERLATQTGSSTLLDLAPFTPALAATRLRAIDAQLAAAVLPATEEPTPESTETAGAGHR